MRCYERSNYEVFIASNETMNKTLKPYIQKNKTQYIEILDHVISFKRTRCKMHINFNLYAYMEEVEEGPERGLRASRGT